MRKHIMTATGFPGRAKTGIVLSFAKMKGLPGLTAILST